MEGAAHERIRKAETNGKVHFWNFERSIQDADRLLGEVGMTERHEIEQWEKEREISCVPQRKPKDRGLER